MRTRQRLWLPQRDPISQPESSLDQSLQAIWAPGTQSNGHRSTTSLPALQAKLVQGQGHSTQARSLGQLMRQSFLAKSTAQRDDETTSQTTADGEALRVESLAQKGMGEVLETLDSLFKDKLKKIFDKITKQPHNPEAIHKLIKQELGTEKDLEHLLAHVCDERGRSRNGIYERLVEYDEFKKRGKALTPVEQERQRYVREVLQSFLEKYRDQLKDLMKRLEETLVKAHARSGLEIRFNDYKDQLLKRNSPFKYLFDTLDKLVISQKLFDKLFH